MYTCVCGKRGPYTVIERHIAEYAASEKEYAATATYGQLVDSDDDTIAHYLPNEPRRPAPIGESDPLPPIPTSAVDDEERPRVIAELFQDMLRAAYQAGAVSASSGESFETWYQREVLQ